MKLWFAVGCMAVLALALALRLPELQLRPMHNDEAVNAIKFRALWDHNAYQYDAQEFHGPTLPYFTLPAAWLSGHWQFNQFTESTYRRVSVMAGTLLIVVLLLLTRDVGRTEIFWSALFTALSPALVFYSRYYIHEMLLVLFTALAGAAAWRYSRSRRPGWILLAGLALGLMAATKETFVFPLAALTLALICTSLWHRWRGELVEAATPPVKAGWLLAAFCLAVIIATLFFTSFFTHASGISDSIKAYEPWLHRAQGASIHIHPWNFYFQRLLWYHIPGGPWWSEAIVAILALIGLGVALHGKSLRPSAALFGRVLGFYTIWLTLIYTFIPYKTPWCLLGFWQGALVLAGMGAAALLRWPKRSSYRFVLVVILTTAAAQLGWQAWRGSFAFDKAGVPYCDSAKNPYVYSQTAPDLLRLIDTIDALATVAPAGYQTPLEVMSPVSYWPLPWYLRRFNSVGYWETIPNQPPAPIMIVSTALQAHFDDDQEHPHLLAGYFELRPNVFLELYVSKDLWIRYIKSLPPEND